MRPRKPNSVKQCSGKDEGSDNVKTCVARVATHCGWRRSRSHSRVAYLLLGGEPAALVESQPQSQSALASIRPNAQRDEASKFCAVYAIETWITFQPMAAARGAELVLFRTDAPAAASPVAKRSILCPNRRVTST